MPSPRPSPAAIMTVIEITPQAMPNMVSSVRRLCAQSVASVSASRSRKDMVCGLSVPLPQLLLEDDLLPFVEPGEEFGLDPVRDSQFHSDFPLSVFAFRVGNFDRRIAVLVIDHGRFRSHQHIFLFFEK